jgi:hypothetical protein
MKNDFENGLPRVDVTITIHCDFCQFSAKKRRFSKKTNNIMIKYFTQTSGSSSCKKRQIFANFVGENIFKITTSVPALEKKVLLCILIHLKLTEVCHHWETNLRLH